MNNWSNRKNNSDFLLIGIHWNKWIRTNKKPKTIQFPCSAVNQTTVKLWSITTFFLSVVLFIIFNSNYLLWHCNEECRGKFQQQDSAQVWPNPPRTAGQEGFLPPLEERRTPRLSCSHTPAAAPPSLFDLVGLWVLPGMSLVRNEAVLVDGLC